MRFSEYCWEMVKITADPSMRYIQRKMAAEWLKLADLAELENVVVDAGVAKRSNRHTEA
jgi:hypothetical protein